MGKMEAQAEYVIQDLKSQITKLSEDRAIYFALATQKQQKNSVLAEKIEMLQQEIESLKDEKGAEE